MGNADGMSVEANQSPGALRVDHVLVPLDGSELALQAMPTARALASRLAADVQTISVAKDEADAARLKATSAAALGADAGDGRVAVASDADPAEAIARRRTELGACVICMASHGRGRLGGALVGSVARSVLLRSAEPMVVLGPSADNPGWSPRPMSWPEPLSVPRIVVCVDGSEASEQILPVAATWARALEMTVTILTVAEDVVSVSGGTASSARYGSHGDGKTYVESLVDRWRGAGVEVDGHVERDPIGPASGVRTHLAARPAGLVALTTHARSGLQRAKLGAQAANIVNASVTPCLVAPVRDEVAEST